MKIVRMVDFFERKFERKEENDFGMLFGITGFKIGRASCRERVFE